MNKLAALMSVCLRRCRQSAKTSPVCAIGGALEIAALSSLSLLMTLAFCGGTALAQQPSEDGNAESQTTKVSDGEGVAETPATGMHAKINLREQMERLSDPSYRVRQLAFWYLEEDSANALPLFRDYLEQLDIDAATRSIDIIADMALTENARIRDEATSILEAVAGKPTYVGRLAANTLEALSDLQEEHAIEVLLHNGATLGPRKFSLNGQIETVTENALRITPSFVGDQEAISWISSIKSVETVSLEGPQIDRTYIEAVSRMRGVQNIKLHKANVTAEDLLLLTRFRSLQHLGLLYLPIDDEAISVLEVLPVSSTMKVYGTKMSIASLERLSDSMPDIKFYCGRGGFLGVSPQFNSGTVIGNVTPNSAAQRAGMKINDEILLVAGEPVKTFADLRAELGKHEAGQVIKVALRRQGQPMTLDVKLQFEP
ncbi:MAG: PDZ domain-containing protein [Aureliella sp.]